MVSIISLSLEASGTSSGTQVTSSHPCYSVTHNCNCAVTYVACWQLRQAAAVSSGENGKQEENEDRMGSVGQAINKVAVGVTIWWVRDWGSIAHPKDFFKQSKYIKLRIKPSENLNKLWKINSYLRVSTSEPGYLNFILNICSTPSNGYVTTSMWPTNNDQSSYLQSFVPEPGFQILPLHYPRHTSQITPLPLIPSGLPRMFSPNAHNQSRLMSPLLMGADMPSNNAYPRRHADISDSNYSGNSVTVQLDESWDPWTQTRGGSREQWGIGSLPK